MSLKILRPTKHRLTDRLACLLLGARMVAWTVALPVLKSRMSIERLVALMRLQGNRDASEDCSPRVIALAWRLSRLQFWRYPDNCLERSLVAFRYLGWAGSHPHLVLGVRREQGNIVGHAWVILDGEPVRERADLAEGFASLIEFDDEGRRVVRP